MLQVIIALLIAFVIFRLFSKPNSIRLPSVNGFQAIGEISAIVEKTDENSLWEGIIGDNFTNLEQVQDALQKAGLEASQLVVGIDYTKSNEWTGKNTFAGKCDHSRRTQRTARTAHGAHSAHSAHSGA